MPEVQVRKMRVRVSKRIRGWVSEENEPHIGITGVIDEQKPHPGCVVVRFEAIDLGYDYDDDPDRRYRFYNIPIDCLISLPEDDIAHAKAVYESKKFDGDSDIDSAHAAYMYLLRQKWPPKPATRVAKAFINAHVVHHSNDGKKSIQELSVAMRQGDIRTVMELISSIMK